MLVTLASTAHPLAPLLSRPDARVPPFLKLKLNTGSLETTNAATAPLLLNSWTHPGPVRRPGPCTGIVEHPWVTMCSGNREAQIQFPSRAGDSNTHIFQESVPKLQRLGMKGCY